MATTATPPDVEELYALGRDRSGRRSRGRERTVELAAGLAFLAVAVGMATQLPATRALQPGTLAILVGVYAVTCRAKFDIADGYTAPTELVLVPMLFLLPTPAVPLVVCLGAALGRAADYASGRTSIHRSLHLFADCWHAVGPALVLVALVAQDFTWADWPVYLAALVAQCGLDFLATSTRAALIDGTRPGAVFAVIAPVYALDAALAPIGLLVAFAAIAVGPAMSLLALPLAVVLAVLSRERQKRVDQALELSAAYQGTAMLLGDVVEADDAYTGSHSRGVVELSLAVADRLRLEGRRRRNVEFAALLHDVGKIAVPDEIINKTGPLDDAEWEIMRRHTIEGERMLKRVGGVLAEVGTIVRASHEDFDGNGYPDGLSNEQIPIEARIVTCCDAFSAMTTTRSYRKAMSTDVALAELKRCAGTQFDPAIVTVLVELIESPES